MGERAAHLVDGVLGGLPVRQWVLTLPFRLRDRPVYDHRFCRAVLGVFVRALLGFTQRRARALGIGGRAGAVTAIQRCGSALNVNPHFHTLVPAGVFAEQRDGSQRFVPLREPPSDVEVARLLATVRGRIIRLLRRHDIDRVRARGRVCRYGRASDSDALTQRPTNARTIHDKQGGFGWR